ncbi:hypothetical protein A3A38_03425 [Candidatus Kaiserbacteria bacterium RIFCSPLOWO2_01_FULL_53_17]|uniref:PPM-type phosphatase domain-containing protein n=1 Tax=Candidatus Kaiserbacteria bacterium RIFCSPLOWO2_01_FULL_53_17 TaxID=1798511 RepID=A0A1F6EIL0_9BACT|nr:MAG: hypothetical protein A3A38_03425 [Candidatus Kaiserbacteria bacterium RIFCSPLOWO2_01_FULL_53_17]
MERSRLRQGNEVPKQWRVAEQESVPKAGRERSEDGFLPGPDCFAVLDGVSSGDSPERIEGLTPGQFAVHIGIEALQAAAQLDTKEEVVSFISARLKEAVRRYELITIPSFVFVAFFPKWNTIIRVGDSLYTMRHRDGEWKGHNPGHKVDADKEVVRQELLKRERGRGATEEELLAHDPTRHRMRRITREWQPQFRNKPDAGERGYGVITGEQVFHIEYIPVGDDISDIILATDWYYPEALKGTSAESEVAQRELIATNRLAWHEDDRTYLRIEKK